MSGFLDRFRTKVITSMWKGEVGEPKIKDIDDKIALGVLLWIVAEADEKFLPEEEAKIKQTLSSYCKIPQEDIPCIMKTIEQAAEERIDLYRFTSEVTKDLPYNVKVSIVEVLFRVACADKELDDKEVEIIRKISHLFGLSHKDFIEAKIKVKKESGLETAL